MAKKQLRNIALNAERLQTLRDRADREINILKKRYDDLDEERSHLAESIGIEDSGLRRAKYKKQYEERTTERDSVKQKLEQLEEDRDAIDEELKKRSDAKVKYATTQEKANTSDLLEEAKNISPESLFKDDEPIKNTVLYVATFFPGLNPHDFKRVVSLLLQGRNITIPVKQSISTAEGKTQITEVEKEKDLTEIWKESFDKPDQYLRDCNLKVYRQNGGQEIRFYTQELREQILTYLEKEQNSLSPKTIKVYLFNNGNTLDSTVICFKAFVLPNLGRTSKYIGMALLS
jgi:hypothetical protein